MGLFGFGRKDNKTKTNKLVGEIFKKSKEFVDLNGEYPVNFNLYNNDNFYISISRLELEKVLFLAEIEEHYKSDFSNFYEKNKVYKVFASNLREIIWLFNSSVTAYGTIKGKKLKDNFDKAYARCIIFLNKVDDVFENRDEMIKYLQSIKLNDSDIFPHIYDYVSKIVEINSKIIENLIYLINIAKKCEVEKSMNLILEIINEFEDINNLVEKINVSSNEEISLDLIKSILKAVKCHDKDIINNLRNIFQEKNPNTLSAFYRNIDTIQEYCEIIQIEINKIAISI